MKASSILAWKYLVSKLHPQLPLNSRESKKLLSLLQDSFRQQLDQEHPLDRSESGRSTNDHLQSILQSPLFKTKPKKLENFLTDSRSSNKVSQIQEVLEWPMEHFKQQVISGSANLNTAKVCLTQDYKKFAMSAEAESKVPNVSSGTASIILNWLWSSGAAETGSFLKDQTFIFLLIPFLVTEGRIDLIWHWIIQLENDENHSSLGNRCRQRRQMLLETIQHETKFGTGIVSSLEFFLQKLSEVMTSRNTSGWNSHGLFNRAGSWLCTEITKVGMDNTIEVPIYNTFYKSVDSWSLRPLYHRGCLELCSPEKPEATSALLYLKKWTPSNTRGRIGTVRLGLKAAELLLSQDSQVDALWVCNFLESNFGQELGFLSAVKEAKGETARDKRHAYEMTEEDSLQSLEALEAH